MERGVRRQKTPPSGFGEHSSRKGGVRFVRIKTSCQGREVPPDFGRKVRNFFEKSQFWVRKGNWLREERRGGGLQNELDFRFLNSPQRGKVMEKIEDWSKGSGSNRENLREKS